jgi:DNA-binding NarL/FixJ family response regulator
VESDQTPRVTVALVEDDQSMRDRLSRVIADNSLLTLVYSAVDAADITEWLENHQPDVLLVDLDLPDASGISVITQTKRRFPAIEIMVLTLFGDETNMISAFEAGASGYLLKDGTEDGLATHIMNLHAGGSPMSPIIARQLLQRLKPPTDSVKTADQKIASWASVDDRLSPKEAEVLSLLSRGYTYLELAKIQSVKITTVHTHVRSIYSKLAVHSKTQAVFEARQRGLLDS